MVKSKRVLYALRDVKIERMEQKTCHHCGAANDPDVTLCWSCSLRVD
ncbi:MAG: hypothetical protein NWE91_03360 [Candidatus Bathyarchaeota archaeon]|nr:hypothetical protein [Candidatus Bathyarchaeota archaeon]